MLKWTSKSSIQDSVDSAMKSSIESLNHEHDGPYHKAVEGSGSSRDDIQNLSFLRRDDDAASDDFVIFRNKNSSMGDNFGGHMSNYSHSDTKWTPLSRKNLAAESRVIPSSLSLPASPVDNKNKSKQDTIASKSGIFTRFKKIFSKSSRDQRSKSLPSSPKHSRDTVGEMAGKQPLQRLEGSKRSHTRLERLIESKRNRRKALGQGRKPMVKTSPATVDLNEGAKPKTLATRRHADRREERMESSHLIGPIIHNSEIQLQPRLLEKSISSQLSRVVPKHQNQDGHFSRASSFRNTRVSDQRRAKDAKTDAIPSPVNTRNKRYSDTFIDIKKSNDPRYFTDMPSNWLNQPQGPTSTGGLDPCHSGVVYPIDTPESQKLPYRNSEPNILPALDPVVIQSTKASLRPYKERFIPNTSRKKLQLPHEQSLSMKAERRKEKQDSKHTINNNNGHAVFHKEQIDELTIRTSETWESPKEPIYDRPNSVADIPFNMYRENIRKAQGLNPMSRSQSSVKDMVRSLEKKIIQTSPSQNNEIPCNTTSGQMFDEISMSKSEAFLHPLDANRQYLIELSEASRVDAFHNNTDPTSAAATERFDEEYREDGSYSFELTPSLNSSLMNYNEITMDEEKNTQFHSGSAGSVWECAAVTLTSQMKTSEFDINFATSPTRSMMTSLSDFDEKGDIDRQENEINSPSTFSKIALDAKEYCDSSSTSFTSSLNVRLVQNEQFLSEQSSLSSCIESISAGSLRSNHHHPLQHFVANGGPSHDPSKLLGHVDISSKEGNSSDDVKSTRSEGGECIDKEILACVNITTSEYVNQLNDLSSESDEHRQEQPAENVECINEFGTKAGSNHGRMHKNDREETTAPIDKVRTTCNDEHISPDELLNDSYARCENEFLIENSTEQEAGYKMNTGPTPMSTMDSLNGYQTNTDVVGCRRDIDIRIEDHSPFTLEDKDWKSEVNKVENTSQNPNLTKRNVSSFVDEDQGMIIFTMPDFSMTDTTQDKRAGALDSSSGSQKRVSFKLETVIMSTSSSDSGDLAQVDGNLSEQSSLPDEDEDKLFDAKITVEDPDTFGGNNRHRKTSTSQSKDGERSLIERSVTSDRNTSPSSIGASDISWVLEPHTTGFMENDLSEQPTIRQLSSKLTLTEFSNNDAESFFHEVLDASRVCDIEEPSLVMNKYTEDISNKCEPEVWHPMMNSLEEIQTTKDEQDESQAAMANVEEKNIAMKKIGENETKLLFPNSKTELYKLKTNVEEYLCTENMTEDFFSVDEQKDSDNGEFSKSAVKPTDIVHTFVEEVSNEPLEMETFNNSDCGRCVSTEMTEGYSFRAETVEGDISIVSSLKDQCPENIGVEFKYNDDNHWSENGNLQCRNLNVSLSSKTEDSCFEKNEMRQTFQPKNDCPSSHSHSGHNAKVDNYSDVTLISCQENDDTIETGGTHGDISHGREEPESNKYCMQNEHSSSVLLSSDSVVKFSVAEARQAGSSLSAKRKNKIRRSLQVSGVDKKDAALFMSRLSMDSSGDCIDSEEETPSSVYDDIAKAITAFKQESKDFAKFERHQRRAFRDGSAARRRSKTHGSHRNRKHRGVNIYDYEDARFDIDTSNDDNMNSARKSQSEQNVSGRTLDFMTRSDVSEFCYGERVESSGRRETGSYSRTFDEGAHLLGPTVEARNTPKMKDVHWTSAVLNYRPGQWLFLATFLFFQLLFHCIFVK